MVNAQLVVDVIGVIADLTIIGFFIVDLKGFKEERTIQRQMVSVMQELMKVLTAKSTEQIEILEEVKEELADIADNTEISEGIEGQNESDSNRDLHGREVVKPEPSCLP